MQDGQEDQGPRTQVERDEGRFSCAAEREMHLQSGQVTEPNGHDLPAPYTESYVARTSLVVPVHTSDGGELLPPPLSLYSPYGTGSTGSAPGSKSSPAIDCSLSLYSRSHLSAPPPITQG